MYGRFLRHLSNNVHAFPKFSNLTGEEQTLDSSYLWFGRAASVRFEDVVRQASAFLQKQVHVESAIPHPCKNAVLSEVVAPKLRGCHGRQPLLKVDPFLLHNI